MNANLFREERLSLIMEMIYDKKKLFVKELADQFGKSVSSIRLDLTELESRGLIERTHGGAILNESIGNHYVKNKNLIHLRDETNVTEKERIGKAVLDLIHDGDSIMIDGGSTTYYVAKHLKEKHGLTIITTSYHLFPILLEIQDAKIFLAGGLVYREYEDLIGDIPIDTIKRFNPDCVIIGMDGVSLDHGLTIAVPPVAAIKRNMIEVGKKIIVVADSSKFGNVSLLHIANLSNVNVIVSDTGVPEKFIRVIEGSGVELILA
ncbi:MAG: DeoR/GlpR transcriptional regulator [Anaerolineaceae bacterium]|nr:DeoR/GlpR transcriptional regulator [Anaerolineaceae bacterium]